MIYDAQKNPEQAERYTVLDARTGQDLTALGVFYADDEKGLIRRTTLDAQGKQHTAHDMPAIHEEIRAVRIVPKDKGEDEPKPKPESPADAV